MTSRDCIIGVFCALVLSACGASNIANNVDKAHEQSPSWHLIWSDEFDGEDLDRTKWEPEISCWGGGNNERQCYTDRPENINVSDGVLTLTARPEIFTGPKMPQGWTDRGGQVTQPYTSGKLRTRNLASWKYGRFEARIKLPKGQSAWAAFWMMPQDDTYGTWPLSGEIDIMEAVNLGAVCQNCEGTDVENRISGALHFGDYWPKNEFITQWHTLLDLPQETDGFHVFALEWREGRMDWFVDGQKFYSVTAPEWFTDTVAKTDNPNAPFDQPFYLMLNLAVGGNLPDGRNEAAFNPATFPSKMVVDWVKVYACTDENGNITDLCGHANKNAE